MQAVASIDEARKQVGDEPLLTMREVQELTKLGRTTVWEAMARGDLPAIRFGRAVRFRRAAVDTWIAQQEQAGNAA